MKIAHFLAATLLTATSCDKEYFCTCRDTAGSVVGNTLFISTTTRRADTKCDEYGHDDLRISAEEAEGACSVSLYE